MTLRSSLRGRVRYSHETLEILKDALTVEYSSKDSVETIQVNNFPDRVPMPEPGIFIVGISVLPSDMIFAIRSILSIFFSSTNMPDLRLFIERKEALDGKLHKSCMQIQVNFTRDEELNNRADIIAALKALNIEFLNQSIRYDVKPAVIEGDESQVLMSGTVADKKALTEKCFVKAISPEKNSTEQYFRFHYLSMVDIDLALDIFAPCQVKRLQAVKDSLERDAAKRGYERNNLHSAALAAPLDDAERSKNDSDGIQAFIDQQKFLGSTF